MNKKYKSMCRVCLLQDSSSSMRPLADKRTREMLFECTSVWVDPEDKYPQQMCCQCWKQCESWSIFQALARESDRQFKFRGKEERPEEEDVVMGEGNMDTTREDQEEDIVMVKEEQLGLVEVYPMEPVEDDAEEEDEDKLSSIGLLDCDSENEQRREIQADTPKRSSEAREKRHKCKVCSKAFCKPFKLKEHERVHTNERPFHCDECKKEFRTNGELKGHKLIHNGKSFECDECDERFTRISELKNHKLRHTGIKTFECDECKKVFNSREGFNIHKLLHAGIKPFECDECDKKFTQLANLMEHKISHSNKTPFKCDLCGSPFKYNKSLTRHLRNKHYV